jgi:hypothetical protein
MKKELKENKQSPTLQQKRAMELMAEKVRNKEKVSISGIMQEVGYSKATAVRPDKLTKSKGWQILLDQYFPDEFLTKEHNRIIKQNKDKRTKLSAISEAYKLKDKYPAQKFKIGAFKERDEATQVKPMF